MKFLALLATALVAASSASATFTERDTNVPANYPLAESRNAIADHSVSLTKRHGKAAHKRKCRAKTSAAANRNHATQYKKHKQHNQSKSHSGKQASSSNKDENDQSSSSSSSQGSGKKAADNAAINWATNKESSSKHSEESSSSSSFGKGVFGLTGSCGGSGATDKFPNGSQSWLNCGVDAGGWKPPHVTLDDLKVLDANEAANSEVFAPCKPILWAFKQAAKKHNVPATLLMSFAMQESTCNPSTTGGNGEQGLMQITQDKCGGAPNGNCKDVGFNVDAGAKYFRNRLDSCGGNALQAMGEYNGWQLGLTVAKATAARWQGNCHAQNNLDYLFSMTNGWLLGKPNSWDMGSYKNLAACK